MFTPAPRSSTTWLLKKRVTAAPKRPWQQAATVKVTELEAAYEPLRRRRTTARRLPRQLARAGSGIGAAEGPVRLVRRKKREPGR
jgi:hypothetical protein